jgi:hypothetical protein
MNIKFNYSEKKVSLSFPINSSLIELNQWNEILYKVLTFAFLDRDIYLITLEPQEYSLGYEFQKLREYHLGKDRFLVNQIDKCLNSQLKEIVISEEFERGLLRIVSISEEKIENVTSNLFSQSIIEEYPKDEVEIMFLEGDGKIIYWFNPSYEMNDVVEKINTIISSVI